MASIAMTLAPEPSSRNDTIDDNVTAGPLETVHNQPTPEPIDGGSGAWKLLGTAFVFEALLWGFPLSFGVFQEYYSKQSAFSGNRYISVVGSVASGISYLGAPVMTTFIRRFPQFRQQMIWVGWPICIASIALASFCSTIETLILTQGVAYGVGFLLFYYSILSMVDEYWVNRRGMAYGLLCSSSGASGAAIPFITEKLLSEYGYRTTLRAIAVAMFVLTGPLIPLLHGRQPTPTTSARESPDWSFARAPRFWIYTVSNIAQGLGYFFPALYLPSYAAAVGLSSRHGALLLALMSIAQVGGQLTFGSLSDRKLPLNALIALSVVVSAVATLALWGLARTLPLLIVFAVLYGFFAAGYTAMWARMASAVTQDPMTTPLVFGLFNFGKGIGNVLCGPISGQLMMKFIWVEKYGLFKFTGVIVFTGSCMVVSALTIGFQYVKLR